MSTPPPSQHKEKEDGRPPLTPVRPCIDFHFHSFYSNDAFGDPAAYVAIAQERGVKAIAPTEHDNIDSLPVYRAAIEAQKVDLALYSGVEIDVRSPWGPLHILAYFFDPQNQPLRAVLEREIEGGMRQMHAVVNKMNAAGERVDLDAAFALYREKAPQRAVGPKAVWKWLERTARAPSYKAAQQLYDRYAKQVPALHESLEVEGVIPIVHQAGGSVVLAHPAAQFTEADVDAALRMGMDGVEVYTPSNNRTVAQWESIGHRRGWVLTGGSDNHAAIESGWSGWPTCAPLSCLESLLGAYEKRFGRRALALIGSS